MTVIVADLGASNARFAVLQDGKVSDSYQFACDDFRNPEKMIASFKNNYAPDATAFVAGVAGVVLGDKVSWTNRKWKISVPQLQKKLGLRTVILKNDVEVQCIALPLLKVKDYKILQKVKNPQGTKALLSVGTGLGVGYFIKGMAYAAEYGQTLTEDGKILEKMLAHLPANTTNQKYFAKTDQNCYEFYQNLARIVLNLALTLKTTGGIYLYGKMLDEKLFVKSKFIRQFRTHPTMSSLLKCVPIYLVKKENLAIIGLKELAKKYGLS